MATRATFTKDTPSTPYFPSLSPERASCVVPPVPIALDPEVYDLGVQDTSIRHTRASSWSSFTGSLPWTGRVWSAVRAFVSANAGLLLVALSQLFFALMNVMVKNLNSLSPPSHLELVAVRMGITYACCIAYMLIARVPHPFLGPPGVRLLLVSRGVCGFVGLFGTYYSLQFLSLSDTTVLSFLSPFTVAVAAHFLLGEVMRMREVWAAGVSLVGVVLIARPTFIFGGGDGVPNVQDGVGPAEHGTPADRLHAVGLMMLGVFGTTGAFLSIRATGHRAHALHSLTSFSLQSVIASSIGMLITRTGVVVPTQAAWLLFLLLIGLFGFVAQFLLTLGLQRDNVGRASMGTYAQLIFASLFDRVFFHGQSSLLSFAGTVLIMGAAVYVAVTKEKVSQPKGPDEAELEEGLLRDGYELEDAVGEDRGDCGDTSEECGDTSEETLTPGSDDGDVSADGKPRPKDVMELDHVW